MSEETVAGDTPTLVGQTAAMPAVSAEDAGLAWSAEDNEEVAAEDTDGQWRHRLRWAVAVALLCATTAAAAWLALAFYRVEFHSPNATGSKNATVPPPTAPPKSMPTVTAPTAKALPPNPSASHQPAPQPSAQPDTSATVSAPAAVAQSTPPPLPDPPPNAYNNYVQFLARDGILATDPPAVMHDEAYWICRARSTGDTDAINGLIVKSAQKSPILSLEQIRTMLADTVEAYCPQYDNG